MVALFSLTLFTSAWLLFMVQLMFAKMALPLLGGTPAVWNTCVVFFQAALLAGYGYAHATTAGLGLRRQSRLHLVLVLIPLAFLPLRVPAGWAPPVQTNPIPWLLGLMTLTVGVPFFVVSSSAPMLQRWFTGTGHPASGDPYFLYAASNLGSLSALLAYPVLVEPYLRLADQSRLWAAGYSCLIVLMSVCAFLVWRSGAAIRRPGSSSASAAAPVAGSIEHAGGPTVSRRLWWVLLSFVPSSYMLGVTTHISTDVAAIPLLWVVPLALYLLTFIIVFARRPPVPHRWMVRWLPLIVLPLAVMMVTKVTKPMWGMILLHLATFFVAAMVCHGELAQERPQPRHLTEYYLYMSLGGVLGGVFNALVAPLVFNTVLEYPLAIVLACLLRPSTIVGQPRPRSHWLDVALPLALGALVAGLVLHLKFFGAKPRWLWLGLLCVPTTFICYSFRYRPIRFGLGLGAFLMVGMFLTADWERALHVERSFFGVYRVMFTRKASGAFYDLYHGTTLHGRQSLDPARRCEPLSYYHPTGPLGQIFAAFNETAKRPQVAVVGLGTGSTAGYAKPGQRWTFYEIDPAVERLARNPRYFTFLQDCAPDAHVVLGDARLSLLRASDRDYGLIIVDAFSSDAIPVHLITRQAVALYLRKLSPGGLLAFHISNRYLELQPVLGDLAAGAQLVCVAQLEKAVAQADWDQGKSSSQWVVMARRQGDLGPLASDARWERVTGRPGAEEWTDDFSNIVSVFRSQ
ncbi:MAG: fused MFS/spermidine synthase [Candidatus Omnitrophica bacterium]|nr:fused MFS/spermidine synthase [Candidatus Omnitrophota bacterium]